MPRPFAFLRSALLSFLPSILFAEEARFRPSGVAPFEWVVSDPVTWRDAQTVLEMRLYRTDLEPSEPLLRWEISCSLGVSVCSALEAQGDEWRRVAYQPIPVSAQGRVTWNLTQMAMIYFNGMYASIHYRRLHCGVPGDVESCDTLVSMVGVDAWTRVIP